MRVWSRPVVGESLRRGFPNVPLWRYALRSAKRLGRGLHKRGDAAEGLDMAIKVVSAPKALRKSRDEEREVASTLKPGQAFLWEGSATNARSWAVYIRNPYGHIGVTVQNGDVWIVWRPFRKGESPDTAGKNNDT